MWIKGFPDIAENDRPLVGGKGLALSRLARLDVPVPPGFVITTDAYRELLRRNSLHPDDASIIERLERAELPDGLAHEITKRLADLDGDYFAVRSSAVDEDSTDKSFAGIFDSYLNVPAGQIVQCVRKCYASLFSARASHYVRAEQPIAVVVQEMVDSRLSGVLFTEDPVGRQEDSVLVECCHGLGELLVSGEITPDRYLLDKTSAVIIEQSPGTQAFKLVRLGDGNRTVALDPHEAPITAAELRALVAISRRIERHFGAACDIEWCIDERGPFIVQSRPITAVAAAVTPEAARSRYTKRFSTRILSPIFEEANVKGFHRFGQDQFELPFSLSGYHLYQPSVNHPHGEVDIWIDDGLDRRVNGWLKKSIRGDSGYLERLETRYLDTVRRFTDFCRHAAGVDYHGAPASRLVGLLVEFDEINQRMTSLYNAPILVVIALAELLNEEMRAQNGSSYDKDFATLAFAGIPNSVFCQEIEFLRILLVAKGRYGLSRWSTGVLGNAEIRQMLSEYHWRWRFLACTDVIGEAFPLAHFEAMLRDRYGEDAAGRWRMLEDRQEQEAREVDAVERRYLRLHYEVKWLRTWLFHRNHTTEYYYRDFQDLKRLLQEVGDRLALSYRDLLNLSIEEIVSALGGSSEDYREHATARGLEGFLLQQQGPEVVLRTGIAPQDRLETAVVKENELEGQVANRGIATGPARIIRDPVQEADRFQTGDILVTAMTTPSFVPLMERASAIVTDEGGVLCHAALVSREMNKPCVIAVHNATQALADGALVTVDAEIGRVFQHPKTVTDQIVAATA
jgi:rifampicin phosphotransferase